MKISLKIFNTIAARGGVALGNFLLPILIASYYGLEKLGLFATIISAITFFHIILKFGMDKVLMREVAKLEKIKEFIVLALKIFLIVLMFLTSLIAVFKVYTNFDFEQYIHYILITSIPFTLVFLNSAIIQALSKPDLGLVFNPGLVSLLLCVLIFFLHHQISVNELLSIYSLMLWILFLISSICVLFFIRNEKKYSIKIFEKKSFIKTSFVFFIISFFIYSQQISLTFTLNYFEDLNTVGLIRYVEKISLIFTFPLMVVVAIFSPRFSFSFYKKDTIKLKSSFFEALKLCSVLGFILFLGLIVCWILFKQFIPSEYENLVIYAIPFFAAQFFNLATGPSNVLLGMVGEEKFLLFLTVFSGLLSIVLFYISLLFLELIYAVYIMNIIYIIRNILQLRYALLFVKESK